MPRGLWGPRVGPRRRFQAHQVAETPIPRTIGVADTVPNLFFRSLLIPVRVENLLPACKNLGVTHITNGCYRLHPVEWAIGEAVGTLAAFCLQRDTSPRSVLHRDGLRSEYQGFLVQGGADLHWPTHAREIAV